LTLTLLCALALANVHRNQQDACGNGVFDYGEQCDDNNNADGDGCDSFCQVECGFTCAMGFCHPVCGDGIKAGSEACDSVTGCTDNCTPAPHYECETDRNYCSPICGNGFVDPGEECDGGHLLEGHSQVPYCETDCTIKEGWICFEDPNKPCVKDCPEEEKTHGKYVPLDEPAKDEPIPEPEPVYDPTNPPMEFVEGRGMEPVCHIPDFDEESKGAEHFYFDGDNKETVTRSTNDQASYTVLAHSEVEGDLKL